MAIIGITAVVLLDQRVAIVQDAARTRDRRTVWVLAAQKLAELELDKTLWVGLGTQNNGDFADVDPEYAPFTWEYQIVREVIETADPATPPKEDAQKRELFRLTLSVRAPGVEDPIVLEGEFSTTPPKTDAEDPSKAGAADPSKPADAAAPPAAAAAGAPK